MTSTETIAAIATPPGMGGVGIVRVSGPLSVTIADAILQRRPQPRFALFSDFYDADGAIIDCGLALLFSAPASFTGEDVLELHGHGGPAVMDLLLARCVQLGARLARPGEFSERAFLNGKLDLAQAEAVADLIASSTELAARMAARSLQGAFSRQIDALVARLDRLRVEVEAALDFPDEDLEATDETALGEALRTLKAETETILGQAHQGRMIREGLTVAIAGRTNVGKSSLLNALSGADTAIVTPIAGTTRDVLTADIQIDGLPIRLVDTAGLRASDDPIEQEGMRRALEQLEHADLLLWVFDATDPATAAMPESAHYEGSFLRIRNKIDLTTATPAVTPTPQGPEIALSVASGAGLDLLLQQIARYAGTHELPEGAFLARRRHVEALKAGQVALAHALQALESNAELELLAEELRTARQALGEITGQIASDELLGQIFSSFCIGK